MFPVMCLVPRSGSRPSYQETSWQRWWWTHNWCLGQWTTSWWNHSISGCSTAPLRMWSIALGHHRGLFFALYPVLFTLYTSHFRYRFWMWVMPHAEVLKIAVQLWSAGGEREYRSLVENFVIWSRSNYSICSETRSRPKRWWWTSGGPGCNPLRDQWGGDCNWNTDWTGNICRKSCWCFTSRLSQVFSSLLWYAEDTELRRGMPAVGQSGEETCSGGFVTNVNCYVSCRVTLNEFAIHHGKYPSLFAQHIN